MGPTDGLVGYSGLVGSHLAARAEEANRFNSKSIETIRGRRFDVLFLAGLPAAKWIANRDPDADLRNTMALFSHLEHVEARKVLLVSTVDVYPLPRGVDETTRIDDTLCHPYGKHRLLFERLVAARFPTQILRLPALFGDGLKKNVVFDFLHRHQVDLIDSRGSFQFYDLARLSRDVDRLLASSVRLLNVTSEPVSVSDVGEVCLGEPFVNDRGGSPPSYDVRSVHAELFGGMDGYLYDRETVLADLRRFVASFGRRGP